MSSRALERFFFFTLMLAKSRGDADVNPENCLSVP